MTKSSAVHSRQKSPKHGERGFTLVLFAAGAAVMIGFTGLAIDVGYILHQRNRMQTAADAAAMAAALEINKGNTDTYVSAAKNDSALNGFTDATAGASVTVASPPSTGPYTGKSGFVEVAVSQAQRTWFMQIFGFQTVPMSARSVAGPGGSLSACIFLLDPSFNYGYTTDGSSQMVSNCGMLVNDHSAYDNQGSTTITNGGIIGVQSGAVHASTGNLSPAPTTIPAVTDPLSLAAPSTVGAVVRSNSTYQASGTVTLNPGIYEGGILCAEGSSVTLNPGTYFLHNGGLKLSHASLQGSGVTLYFYGIQNTTALLSDSVSRINLTAPTSGTLEARLIQMEATGQDWGINIQSNGQTYLEGILYMPGDNILWESQSANYLGHYTIIVAKHMRIDGSGTTLKINNDYTVLSSGNPLKSGVALGE